VQVFGDGAGFVTVLGERDCSTQRRRQKVIEEAPAPALDVRTRQALHDGARTLLEQQCYRSAGTVEFIVDATTGEFFFLEVNTRLQVEHAVTEAITGVDLVEWMVRLADGDATAAHRYTYTPNGHAIEVRVYAEDPAKDFTPCAGLVTDAVWPADARVDTWVSTGTDVSLHYDPLLAKVIVHGSTRDDAIARLGAALDATRVSGIETNLDLVRSFVAGPAFVGGRVTTTTLGDHTYARDSIDVLVAGNATSVQDWPGRLGYWHVGVPPSGPMDDRSFRLGNRLLGNGEGAPGLECTAVGPTLRFNTDTHFCLSGARMHATLDGHDTPYWTPVRAPAGSTLTLGAVEGPGLRTYVLVAGGLAVPGYLGSASTFALGEFGGHGGRTLRTGDVLHLARAAVRDGAPTRMLEQPVLTHAWTVGVVDGPHGAPEFFTAAGIEQLYATEWSVHYNSSRTGVRLVGPKLEWARPDGGEAGLHPSNIHDTPYSVGAVDFTGDMPVVLGPDGPSLGGFVCPVTIVADERWKIGQLAPGDTVRFVRTPGARPAVLAAHGATDDAPEVTYRRAGDRALLVEYGPMVLDLDLRMRAQALLQWLHDARITGVVDLTPGIRSLHIQVDDDALTVERLLPLVKAAEGELPSLAEVEVPSRVVHLPLSWDDPATREATARYMQSVRDDAPWCPWNIEFIRRVNGLDHVDDVRRIVYDAEYLVLGLGDVYLGAPVAVPVDPRHRLVTTKYNPARTWTPENAVGIGGAYLCIYGMEGPGGYQFVGRTIPIWRRYGADPPWLLRHFDRIRWYPVAADELLELRADARAGRFEPRIEPGVFRRADHQRFLATHRDEIATFTARRQRAFDTERTDWEASGELTRSVDDVVSPVAGAAAATGELPAGAVVVESFMHACVWRVEVEVGDTVEIGTRVVTVEAMKTETEIETPVRGVVHEVMCAPGQLVEPGSPLVVIVEQR
jgi:urea carboxylase